MSKPAARQKPKPPPYPRPVPKFVVEELPPRAVDVAWDAVNDGEYYLDESDGERRAAKRRRIEACAIAYLRGEPLYIMSAQLKGPFDEEWRNPWAKKRRGLRKVGGDVEMKSLEIPETTRKVPSSVEEEKGVDVRMATPEPRPVSAGSRRREQNGRAARIEQAPSPFTSRVQTVPDETSPKVPRHVKERRVKDWLRTNDAFVKTSEILVHSSPTPVSRQRRTPTHEQDEGSIPKASQSEPPTRMSPIASPVETARSLQPQHARKLSSAQKRVQGLSREMQNMLAEPVAQTATNLQHEVSRLVNPSASSKRLGDSSRAEFAILKARRSGLQTLPADAHMSPFEFRKVPGKDVKATDGQPLLPANESEKLLHLTAPAEVKADHAHSENILVRSSGIETDIPIVGVPDAVEAADEEVFATAPQPEVEVDILKALNNVEPGSRSEGPVEDQTVEPPPALDIPRPALSTVVSEISIADMLPSAQPRLEPQPSVSSVTHEKMLSIKPATSVSEKAGTDVDTRDDEGKSRTTENANQSKSQGAPELSLQSEETPPQDGHESTPIAVLNAAILNTQEMLANIGPLELSTVKKPRAATKKDTPATATRTRSDKKRKKTSFAVDSSGTPSHSSIKDVMKAKVSKQLASPPVFLFSKDDLDIEVSDDEEESQRKRSRQISCVGKPKSILKSTNPASSPGSLKRSKSLFSTGQEQDGQQRNLKSGQNGVADDHFDLDAAIDDLGSFLGTWDAEKEASSLDIEL